MVGEGFLGGRMARKLRGGSGLRQSQMDMSTTPGREERPGEWTGHVGRSKRERKGWKGRERRGGGGEGGRREEGEGRGGRELTQDRSMGIELKIPGAIKAS